MRYGVACVAFIGDNSQRAFLGNGLSDYGAAVGFVGNNCKRWLLPVKKSMHQFTVMNMPAADSQPDRAAFGVYSRVNLTCATSA